MTFTAYQFAQTNFNFRNFSYALLPLDIDFLMRRYLAFLRPRILVTTEGEHWPFLLKNAKTQKTPSLLINGRISKSSYERLRAFPKFSRFLFSHYSYCFLKSKQDRERYIKLGMEPQKILLTGDLKFDAPSKILPRQEILKIRKKLGIQAKDFVFVAGSTRPPKEEEILIDIFIKLREKHARRIKFLLAPRHLHRLGAIKKLLSQKGLKFSLYSARNINTDLILVEQMGVLQRLYASADLCFVGGTMSNTGGHNILEPVWAGRPVLFGPDVRNISDMANYICKNNYGAQAKNSRQLLHLMDQFLRKKKTFKRRSNVKTEKAISQSIGECILNFLGPISLKPEG